jgi:hypothetical protein
MKPPEFEMPVALSGMGELVEATDLGEERSWVRGQWVKKEPVYHQTSDLPRRLAIVFDEDKGKI